MARRFFFQLFFFAGVVCFGQTIYPSLPDYTSNALGYFATGLGIADINQDGWDDIITANGNDMARQPVTVYYNNGDGTFPANPSWSSSDVDYHGHLSVGDINGDNLPDLAVSVFLGPGGFNQAGHVKVYLNQGNALESTPSWRSGDDLFTFSCALGDADGDGDLDLAVAGGQPYNIGIGPYLTYGRVYYNQNGILDSLPGWQSTVTMAALDVGFADLDNNGFLDLVFANHLTPNYIFLADSLGQLASAPSWSSQDADYHANSLTFAHLDGNDYLDVIISDNNQLGGQGRFKAYLFNGPPTGQSQPGWLSATGGFGSAVLAEDLTLDQYPDLLAGRWWGAVQLYRGSLFGLETNPFWSSATGSVVEAYALRDLDQDHHFTKLVEIVVDQDSGHVVYLPDVQVEQLVQVSLNGRLLIPGQDFCSTPDDHWISTVAPLQAGDTLRIHYIASYDRDLVVSNWDNNIGNYIFYNQLNPTAVHTAASETPVLSVSAFPNPFNQQCRFRIELPQAAPVKITIFDLSGRRVTTLSSGAVISREYELVWDGTGQGGLELSSGIYFYRVAWKDQQLFKQLFLIR